MTTPYILLRTQHTSLQFSDTPKQQAHDVEKLFAKGERFPIKTGTEAGPSTTQDHNRRLLRKFAKEFDHEIHFGAGNWVAVDRGIIVPGTFTRNLIFVAKSHELVGKMRDRVMPVVSFEHKVKGVGRIHQGAAHYAKNGAKPGDPNYLINKRYALSIYKWMLEVAGGSDKAFVNGDFNMNDRSLDWFHGLGITSMADELKKWQNTGHGPIDGMASFDKDGRVKAHAFNVLDDKKFFLYSDHFACRGTWRIRKF